METWGLVPRSRRWTDANTVSQLRRSVALQGIGQQWEPAMATLIDGDLEGCGPSQPPADRCQHRFTATTERSPPGNRPAMAASRGNADRWSGWMVRSERPLRREPFPQLFDFGNRFPDLRLRQVLAQLGRKFDQFLVHAHQPASEHLGGSEQKARGPRVAVSQGLVKCERRDSPQMAFGAGNRSRGPWRVEQWTHLAKDSAGPQRS